jgi:titin
LHDDQPIHQANRFNLLFEFGFCALRVKQAIPEDSGVYTVVARNALGEDRRQCNVTVLGREGILDQTQHEQSIAKIEYLGRQLFILI